MVSWNPLIKGLRCIRCAQSYPVALYPEGCPACRQAGEPASIIIEYQHISGLGLHEERLPFRKPFSCGEANTPLIQLAENVWLKNEGANPTGSHKDRMSSFAVSHALLEGKKNLVIASSGNAGVSLAYYAQKADLHCTVIMSGEVTDSLNDKLKQYGADVLITEDSASRWMKMKELVQEKGYYPVTNYAEQPVGSNLFGVQGYKTIAYELADQQPDFVIVPVSRGDLLWGVYEGFTELLELGEITRLPKMIAVEPIDRLTRVMAGESFTNRFRGTTEMRSIAGGTVTYQAAAAITRSRGGAVTVSDEEALKSQAEAKAQGLALELSSAVVFPAYKNLMSSGAIPKQASVVLIGTSSGTLLP